MFYYNAISLKGISRIMKSPGLLKTWMDLFLHSRRWKHCEFCCIWSNKLIKWRLKLVIWSRRLFCRLLQGNQIRSVTKKSFSGLEELQHLWVGFVFHWLFSEVRAVNKAGWIMKGCLSEPCIQTVFSSSSTLMWSQKKNLASMLVSSHVSQTISITKGDKVETTVSVNVCMTVQQLHLIPIRTNAKAQSSSESGLLINEAIRCPEFYCFFFFFLSLAIEDFHRLCFSRLMSAKNLCEKLINANAMSFFFTVLRDLSNNGIMSIQANAFSQMKNLREL